MLPCDYDESRIEVKTDITLGYLYFIDPDHPLASPSTGKVYHHRHVASVALGRWLTPEEVVHHKDGTRTNNSADNLEVMTRRSHGEQHAPPPEICVVCASTFRKKKAEQRFCSNTCKGVGSREFNPSAEDLRVLVWAKTITAIAAEFGVSDAAVHKRCKALGVEKPPRGFWLRKSL